MTSRSWKFLAAAAVAGALGMAAFNPFAPKTVHAETDGGPVVVELFTSQSCYSCPPAEAFLGELVAENDDVIALEWHVDYWDKLVYRGSAWKDVFSDPAFTDRQRVYATRMPRGHAYTPQMVIDGKREAVGSRRGDVYRAIREVAKDPRLAVSAEKCPDGTLAINIDGARDETAAVWVVTYLKSQETDVRGGENKGKSLANHNIVRSVARVGEWTGERLSIDVPVSIDDGHDCAVLVQTDDQGPILGAARCSAGDAVRS